jgi:hypothetical protein
MRWTEVLDMVTNVLVGAMLMADVFVVTWMVTR